VRGLITARAGRRLVTARRFAPFEPAAGPAASGAVCGERGAEERSRTPMRRIVLGAMLALVAAVATARASGPELKTDEEKTLYALGRWASDKLAPFTPSEKELGLVEAGRADGGLKRAKQADLTTLGPVLDRGAPDDEGRGQGEARLPLRHRVRRSGAAAADRAGRTAGV